MFNNQLGDETVGLFVTEQLKPPVTLDMPLPDESFVHIVMPAAVAPWPFAGKPFTLIPHLAE